jgi:hypothetical protein
VQRQIWVLGFFLLAVGAGAAAQAGNAVTSVDQAHSQDGAAPDLASIVTQMQAAQVANPARSQPYILVRQYRFYQGTETSDGAKSEVVAQVSFTPPNVKKFDILETRGSGRGTSAVKHILENEADLCKDVSRNEVSKKNYDFSLMGESMVDGRRAYILGITPLREDHALLRGRVYVDAVNFRILRTEGQPARSPSWWLRSSYIVVRYAEADGLWLPVATEGSGEVRMFGRFFLNSDKVSVQVGNQVASARPQPAIAPVAHSTPTTPAVQPHSPVPRRHVPVAVGAGVIPNH